MNIDNFEINIVSTDVNAMLYDDYIKNEHYEKIEIYKNFVSQLEPSHFFNTLQNNVFDVMIKYIISKHNNIDFILNDLYTHNISDFTIKFLDGKEFKCLKGILKQIPYFLNILEDTEVNDTITLNIDSEIAITVLKLLYKQNSCLTINNIYKIIKLMDMWLMDCIDLYLPFIDANIDEIVDLLLKDDDLIILVNILEKENFDMKKIFNRDIKNIFIFENWQDKFSDEQKIKAIETYNKYDLLNISKISPIIVLDSLLKIGGNDNDDIIDFLREIALCNSLFFREMGQVNDKTIVAVIDSYYPSFKVSIYCKTDLYYTNKNLSYKKSDVYESICPYKKINVDDKLLIGKNLQLLYKNPDLNYIASMKCNDKNFNKICYREYKNLLITIHHIPLQEGDIWKITNYDYHY